MYVVFPPVCPQLFPQYGGSEIFFSPSTGFVLPSLAVEMFKDKKEIEDDHVCLKKGGKAFLAAGGHFSPLRCEKFSRAWDGGFC